MLSLSVHGNKEIEDKTANINVNTLKDIKKKIDDLSNEVSILIEKISKEPGIKKKTKSKQIKNVSRENNPTIQDILSRFEKESEENFKKYILSFDLTLIKKIISENGYGIPKVTSKWQNKEKLVDYFMRELKKMSKKGDSLR